MTSQYLTPQTFTDISLMPPSYADEVERMHPGWLAKQLMRWSAWIDSRLAKRYATPFDADSPPMVVEEWLSRILTPRCYLKRGVDPTDSEVAALIADGEAAKAEIAEAANAEKGLFELPLRADQPGTDAVVRSGPLGYAEASPYTWPELQLEAACNEGWGLL